jgi:hypothetical protein
MFPKRGDVSATMTWQDGAELPVERLAKRTGGILMALDPNTPRSRRALLAAAAGGAAAVAASAATPLTAAAAPLPMVTETAMVSAAETSLADTGDRTVAFKTTNLGVAPALLVSNAAGVATTAGETDPSDPGGITSAAGIYAYSVNGTDAQPYWATTYTGIYGWAPAFPTLNGFGSGLWGDSEDVGTYGSGAVGVRGDGLYGMVAASAPGAGGAGLLAWGGSGSGADVALDVRGKARFSRSGRATIGAGKSSIKINLTGVSWSSLVFAELRSNRSGRYVRAVVPTTGSFTIYLNIAVASSTYVVWFVVN